MTAPGQLLNRILQHRHSTRIGRFIECRDRIRAALGERYHAGVARFVELIELRQSLDESDPLDALAAMHAVLDAFRAEPKDTRAQQVLTIAAGVDLMEAEQQPDALDPQL